MKRPSDLWNSCLLTHNSSFWCNRTSGPWDLEKKNACYIQKRHDSLPRHSSSFETSLGLKGPPFYIRKWMGLEKNLKRNLPGNPLGWSNL